MSPQFFTVWHVESSLNFRLSYIGFERFLFFFYPHPSTAPERVVTSGMHLPPFWFKPSPLLQPFFLTSPDLAAVLEHLLVFV